MSDFLFAPLRPYFCAALAKRWKVQFRQGFAYFNNKVDSRRHLFIGTAIYYVYYIYILYYIYYIYILYIILYIIYILYYNIYYIYILYIYILRRSTTLINKRHMLMRTAVLYKSIHYTLIYILQSG